MQIWIGPKAGCTGPSASLSSVHVLWAPVQSPEEPHRALPKMEELKLIALDAEDLRILSCHLQDAVIRVGDMAYLKEGMRFAAIANRFDWEGAVKSKDDEFQRRRTGLRFERVKSAQVQGIDLKKKDLVLVLLAVAFEPGDEPRHRRRVHNARFLRRWPHSGRRQPAAVTGHKAHHPPPVDWCTCWNHLLLIHRSHRTRPTPVG